MPGTVCSKRVIYTVPMGNRMRAGEISVMGSAGDDTLLWIFGLTPMPATLAQLEKNCGRGNGELAYRVVNTRLGCGVIKDSDGRYRLSDDMLAKKIELLTKRIESAKEDIATWQKYIDTVRNNIEGGLSNE